jgi:uncharacterized iron-regulated membrane protein
MSRLTAVAVAAVAAIAGPALADRAPPQNAMPLSQVLQALEQQGQVAHFKEVEWDDDGYWEIEYALRSGGTAEVKVDPVSGQPRK